MEFEVVNEESLDRCQYIIPTRGQCNNKKVPGSEYCPAHGGTNVTRNEKKKELRNYRLNKFRERTQELGNNDEILSLKDEIGILRLLIEEKINKCKDSYDMILMSGPLSDLIMKVEKVVSSCNRLENKLGNRLDKSAVLQMAQTMVTIISNHVTDEEILEKISNEILGVM